MLLFNSVPIDPQISWVLNGCSNEIIQSGRQRLLRMEVNERSTSFHVSLNKLMHKGVKELINDGNNAGLWDQLKRLQSRLISPCVPVLTPTRPNLIMAFPKAVLNAAELCANVFTVLCERRSVNRT